MNTSKLAAIFLLSIAPALAQADEVSNINEDLGVKIEDALATPLHELQVQLNSNYQREGGAVDRYSYSPNVQFGLIPRGHLDLQATGLGGKGNKTGSGDLRASFLYEVIKERLALIPRLNLPTGINREGVEPGMKLAASYPFPDPRHRAHVNAQWDHATHPLGDERRDRLGMALGYSWQLSDKVLALGDIFLEQERGNTSTSEFAEIGAVIAPVKNLTVGAGVGVAVGVNAGDIRANLSAQISLGG